MQPGSPASLMPPGEDWLVRKVQELERRVNELVAHDVLRAAGVETAADLFKILGTLRVTGDTVIEGDLSVPNGSIDNAALANPVIGTTGTASTGTGVALPSSLADFAVVTFTVPAGFTRAVVLGVTTVTVTTGDMIMSTAIGGSGGLQARCYVDSFGFGNGATSHAATLTGLSGGSTFTVRSQCARTGSSSAALIATSASVTFLR